MSSNGKKSGKKSLKPENISPGLTPETEALLNRYFTAFSNLYGIITLSEAYEIINSQNGGLLSFDELYRFSDKADCNGGFYSITGHDELWDDGIPATPENREIIADYLLSVDEDDYYNLVEMQRGKPLYIPDKEQLLLYADEYYYEETPQTKALADFLRESFGLQGEDLTDAVFDSLTIMNISTDSAESALGEFSRYSTDITDGQIVTLYKLLTDLNINMRKHCHRGHTGVEIAVLTYRSPKYYGFSGGGYDAAGLSEEYSSLGLSGETTELLKRYFNAFANLYGILSLSDAFSVIDGQNKNLLTFEELYRFSAVAKKDRFYYTVKSADEMWDREPFKKETCEIIADYLVMKEDDAYYNLWGMQEGKPLYVPDKDELLRYEDEGYYEVTKYTRAMERFFRTLGAEDDTVADYMDEVIIRLRTGETPTELISNFLDERSMSLKESEAKNFFRLLCELNNHARMHCNRGYTPEELGRLIPAETSSFEAADTDNVPGRVESGELSPDEARDYIICSAYPEKVKLSLLAQIARLQGIKVTEKRPARNAPCPCGSGKKYKQCCGKDR